jgi:L-lactate dehydrogenase complex protein LldE
MPTPSAQLLITCLIDAFFPEIGEAVFLVLRDAGAAISFPREQTCCGQPAFNAGQRTLARQMAEHTLRVFLRTEGPIVVPSGSCTAMIRHGYVELFRDVPEWRPAVEAVAARTVEFSEFLVDHLHYQPAMALEPRRWAYHSACHLEHDLHIVAQPLELLRSMNGGRVERLPSECCGFGGIFAIQQPELSAELLARKLGHIEESEADTVVACDTGCLMQIEGGLRRRRTNTRSLHLAQALAGPLQERP